MSTRPTVDHALDPRPDDLANLLCGEGRAVAVRRHQSARHRVGRVAFHRRHQRPQIFIAPPPDHRQPALGEGAGLVKDHQPGPGEVLQSIAALDEDLLAGGAADRGAHRQRRRETEGARAADDQQRHRVLDRVGRVEPCPDHHRGQGQGQHDGDEPPRDPVRQQHHRRAPLGALLDQPHQAADPGVLAGRPHLDQETRREVHSARVHRVAGCDLLGQRLAGEQRAVQRRGAFDHYPVGGDRVPGSYLDHRTRRQGLERHLSHSCSLDQPGGRRRQREHQLGRARRLELLAALEETAHQQKEDQRRHRFEVDLARAAHRVDRALDEAGQDADGDWQVHVEAAGAQSAPRAAVEDRRAPHDRGQGETEADPAEKGAVLVGDAVEVAAVKREGDQHHVAGDGPRHRDPDQQSSLLAPRHVARLDPAEGVGDIADGVEEPRHVRKQASSAGPRSPWPAPGRDRGVPRPRHPPPRSASRPATRRPRSGPPPDKARRSRAPTAASGSRDGGKAGSSNSENVLPETRAACSGASIRDLMS